ncbi:unnamed protein product [Musa banksii]
MGERLVGVSRKQRRPVASAAPPSLFSSSNLKGRQSPWNLMPAGSCQHPVVQEPPSYPPQQCSSCSPSHI